MLQRKIRKSGRDRTRNTGKGYFAFEGDRREEGQILDLGAKLLLLACIGIAFIIGAFFGSYLFREIKTATLPIEQAASSIEHKLKLLTVGKPQYDGTNTTITHVFHGEPNYVYTIAHTSDLSKSWEMGEQHHTTDDGTFYVTVSKKGDHTDKWNQSMFFKVTKIDNAEQPKLLARHD